MSNLIGITNHPSGTKPLRRVVVADDDPDVRQALVELLEDEVYLDVVAAAGDGTETIARCVIYRPDVLVVDVSMPNGGGELAVQVLSVQLPDMRIIAMSANSDRATRRRMAKAGAHDFVPKGDMSALVERVTRA